MFALWVTMIGFLSALRIDDVLVSNAAVDTDDEGEKVFDDGAAAAEQELKEDGAVSDLEVKEGLEAGTYEYDGMKWKVIAESRKRSHFQFSFSEGNFQGMASIHPDALIITKSTSGVMPIVFFRDSVHDGEEIVGIEGELFVEAEFDKEVPLSDAAASLVEVGQASTGLVHVGREWKGAGIEELVQLKASLAVNHTKDKFGKGVTTMLNDDFAGLVVKASHAVIKGGYTAAKNPYMQAFHMFAVNLAKFSGVTFSNLPAGFTQVNTTWFWPSSDPVGYVVDLATTTPKPWNPSAPHLPYDDCGNTHMGRCGAGNQCWEGASGCKGCDCKRGCEYHDHYCSCEGWTHQVCWQVDFGGWENCGKCVGPSKRAEATTRRRRFW